MSKQKRYDEMTLEEKREFTLNRPVSVSKDYSYVSASSVGEFMVRLEAIVEETLKTEEFKGAKVTNISTEMRHEYGSDYAALVITGVRAPTEAEKAQRLAEFDRSQDYARKQLENLIQQNPTLAAELLAKKV